MRDGDYDYVANPIGLAELIIRIENALSRRALLMDIRVYQRRQEELIGQLNSLLEQRKRDLSALNSFFQSHIGQSQAAQTEYNRLKETLASFNTELEGLATMVGVADKEESAPPGYDVKQVKLSDS